jgi:MerR family Zn(II)-responsive transcriptional regulator of zntA
MGAEYTSGDLARATGNTVRTIRFYEEEGLLEPSEVSDGGHRRYADGDLERLNLIGDLRELGMSLCEIRDVLALRKGCSCVAEFATRLEDSLAAHVAEAQKRIERLERVRKEIERTISLVHSHLDTVDGTLRPCDLSCGPDAPKMLRVLAARDAHCVLHESGEEKAQAAAKAAAPPEPAEPVGPAWTLAADSTRR